jgi:hypothetical protein
VAPVQVTFTMHAFLRLLAEWLSGTISANRWLLLQQVHFQVPAMQCKVVDSDLVI